MQYRYFYNPTSVVFTARLPNTVNPSWFLNQYESSFEQDNFSDDIDAEVIIDGSLNAISGDPAMPMPSMERRNPGHVLVDYGCATVDYYNDRPNRLRLHPTVATASALLSNLGLALLRHKALIQHTAIVHAGAFETNLGAIMIVGDSGTGKSTFCVQAARIGNALISDDMLYCYRDDQRNLALSPARRNFTLRKDVVDNYWSPSQQKSLRQITVTQTAEVKFVADRDSGIFNTIDRSLLSAVCIADGFSNTGLSHWQLLPRASAFAQLYSAFYAMVSPLFNDFS